MPKWTTTQKSLAAVFFAGVWIAVPIWIWKSLPSDEEYKWKRIYDIEQAVKTQRQVVNIAILEENYSETPSKERLDRLKRIQQKLEWAEEL
jgi:hypothetical protein